MKKIGIKAICMILGLLLTTSAVTITIADDNYDPQATVDFIALPANQQIQLGESFDIEIWVDPNGEIINALSTDFLFWNHSLIKLTGISINGDFLVGSGSPIKVQEFIYTMLPDDSGIPGYTTKTWNYTLPYELGDCHNTHTYLWVGSGTYSVTPTSAEYEKSSAFNTVASTL